MTLPIWITDPKTKTKSVSLTTFVLATLMYVGAIGANMAGVQIETSLITQFWFGSVGLYFGRRMTISKDGIESIERNKEDAR